MTVVYIDRVFLINSIVDYLLLLSAARIAGMPLQRCRLALSAVIGGVYAAILFLPGFALLSRSAAKFLWGIIMALLAYWPLQKRWYLTGLFLLLSATLGGIVLALGLAAGSVEALAGKLYSAKIEWPLPVCAGAALYMILHLVFRQGARHKGGELLKITISLRGAETEVLALRDTGNTLRDPISGQPVLVAECAALSQLFGEETTEILRMKVSAEEKMANLHRAALGMGFTLLPYRCVGISSGLLLAFRCDRLTVGNARYRNVWVAISNTPVSDGGTYNALWGGVRRGEEYGAFDREIVPLDPQEQQAG